MHQSIGIDGNSLALLINGDSADARCFAFATAFGLVAEITLALTHSIFQFLCGEVFHEHVVVVAEELFVVVCVVTRVAEHIAPWHGALQNLIP